MFLFVIFEYLLVVVPLMETRAVSFWGIVANFYFPPVITFLLPLVLLINVIYQVTYYLSRQKKSFVTQWISGVTVKRINIRNISFSALFLFALSVAILCVEFLLIRISTDSANTILVLYFTCILALFALYNVFSCVFVTRTIKEKAT
ncbi:MAG: hypothetical protein LBL41_00370 [Bifidobacteriaceae bacterium]|nr:hypothetical protein [Bifidobacteriaceae bacterium]